MTEPFITDNPELDALFERYRQAPKSHVFAPLADACRKAGLIDEAIDICDRGVEENPGYTSGHVVRGKCYYDRGDRRTAVACFERVLELDPNNLVALKILGLIQADAGDAAGARERFKHILALDPDNREIRQEMDILDEPPADTGATAQATPDVPPDPPAAEDVDEPVEDDFEAAPIALEIDSDPTTDELATMTLADIYAEQGYADKALRIYREVLRRQPDNDGLRRKILALGGEVDDIAPVTARASAEETARQMEHFEDAPMLEDEVEAVLEGADAHAEAPADDADDEVAAEPSFPPAPGAVIELPPPEDMETVEAEPDAPASADGESEPQFEEIETRPEHTEPAPSRSARDRNHPLGPQRRSGTIDEGRSYEQFKRWLKNLSD